MTTPTLTIAICTYTEDRYELLLEAIDSALCQREVACEVVVITDYNEALYERLCRDRPTLSVVRNRQTKGLSGGRNTALEVATADIVAFLDDDGVMEADWALKITNAMSDPTVIGAGSQVVARWQSARPACLAPEFDWVVGCSYRGLPTVTAPIRNPSGGAMAVRRAPALGAGGFRSDLGRVGTIPLGCEETDLFIRLGEQFPQHRTLYVPTALMRHFVPANRCTWKYLIRRCYGEGLSKAQVARLHPTGSALGTERRHITHVLPLAVLREARHGNLQGAAGVIAGLGATVFGYVRGIVGARLGAKNAPMLAMANDVAR